MDHLIHLYMVGRGGYTFVSRNYQLCLRVYEGLDSRQFLWYLFIPPSIISTFSLRTESLEHHYFGIRDG